VAELRSWILQQLEAERGRWMLWLPVAFGLGIAIYFELPSEPAMWLGPGLAAAASAAMFMAPAGSRARALCIALAAAAAGLGLATWRTESLAAPTLGRPLFSINVEGRVADIQRLPEGRRVVLEAVRLKGSGAPVPEKMPARLRVSLGKGAPPLHVGDRILVLANLSPPSGPAAPGAFDFQRVAWYQQLGAVGYALAPAAVTERGRPEPQRRLDRQLEIDRNPEPHRHRQPQHPASALSVELLQYPGSRPRHLPSFDRPATLPYLRRAFWAQLRPNPHVS